MARIEIVDYQIRWPQEFDDLARVLTGTLGDLATRIEHIGSTAVPGLAAKDVIDVQVSVAAEDLDSVRPRLEAAGFAWWADICDDHLPAGAALPARELEKRVASNGPGMRRSNIHFRVPGRFNHRYALLCRDHLRAHPMAAAAYGEIKRNLARLFPDDADSYYDVKDPVFDLIMAAAEEWAVAVGWTAGRPLA